MGWLLDLIGWLVYHTSDLGTAALLILFSSTTSGPKAGWHGFKIFDIDMGMDQYLLIPFLGGWTSIYQLITSILMFTRGTRFWHTAISINIYKHSHVYDCMILYGYRFNIDIQCFTVWVMIVSTVLIFWYVGGSPIWSFWLRFAGCLSWSLPYDGERLRKRVWKSEDSKIFQVISKFDKICNFDMFGLCVNFETQRPRSSWHWNPIEGGF